MPIYEYQCGGCAYRFELKQSIKDDPVKECPRCGQDVTKLISSPAIMFKGSGWYITDYSDKMKPGSEKESSEQPAASGTDKTKKTPASSETAGTSPAGAPTPRHRCGFRHRIRDGAALRARRRERRDARSRKSARVCADGQHALAGDAVAHKRK